MLTSLTWIMWTQFSTSRAAQTERESKEITYAYAINGGFIIMALIGIYLDSFGQCRIYYRRWSLLNQDLIIMPYDMKKDTKTANLLLSPHDNTANASPTFYVSRTLAASTPNTSANKSISTEPHDGTSLFFHKSDRFVHDVQIFENSMDTNADAASQQHQWPATATSYVVNTPSNIQQSTLYEPASEPAISDLLDILVLKETYV